ncbi:hypothetical protein D641_0109730 [Brachybacterium muris UCD-AY4]|uniref:Uncharacterized protein n=1 Tax=Brachybacterium muris UCD-AY4 TaxID=1249481 RepID=A0A022L018_9MICO|nr:hypothetical protein D641_0109730 [Brachybacterium muris UCD-AY4]
MLAQFHCAESVRLKQDATQIMVSTEIVLGDAEMHAMLTEDEVLSLNAMLASPRTFYSQVLELQPRPSAGDRLSVDFSAPMSQLNGPVTLQFSLIAEEPLPAYRLSSFHPDYEGFEFGIERGQVVGLTPPITLDLDDSYDALAPPPSSFVDLRLLEDSSDRTFMVDTTEDKLVILFRGELNQAFQALPLDQLEVLVRTAVIQPALVQVLSQYFGPDADPEDVADVAESRWHRSLATLIDTHDLDGQEPFEQAAKILKDPSLRAVKNALQRFQDDDDDE